ncbi:MAG: hypothetical protein DMD28_11405 [Gemmatimonadetes bacterium]|nr:MAG: hypothetical protein DMD28_11405 [Gemmatimonadota bacterium]
MRPFRCFGLVVFAAVAGLETGGCGLPDVFRPAGLNDVVVTYCGDTLLKVGVRQAAVVTVQADGVTIPNPRLTLASSDSTILSLTPIGDTLVAQKSGDVLLTIRVVSSMVTGAAPSAQDSVHVRGGGSAPRPPCP